MTTPCCLQRPFICRWNFTASFASSHSMSMPSAAAAMGRMTAPSAAAATHRRTTPAAAAAMGTTVTHQLSALHEQQGRAAGSRTAAWTLPPPPAASPKHLPPHLLGPSSFSEPALLRPPAHRWQATCAENTKSGSLIGTDYSVAAPYCPFKESEVRCACPGRLLCYCCQLLIAAKPPEHNHAVS